ncbi:MAG: DUF4179 domain-containing protein [Agathobacter sp.]
MSKQIEDLLFDSLMARDEPAPALNRQILERWSKEDRTMKRKHFYPKAAVAACVCVLATGSITAYAAYHFLNPAQIAEEAHNIRLSNVFESDCAIEINETQISNGYRITLLGLVSGENLDAYVPEGKKSEIDRKKTYAAFAIERVDETDIKVDNLCISALVSGIPFSDMNNANMGGSLTWFVQDGVLYELYTCDNLEIFADRGVYLGVVDMFGRENAAFHMDEESGAYRKVEDYEGTAALFQLPLDKTLADETAVQQYLEELKKEEAENSKESESSEETVISEENESAEAETLKENENPVEYEDSKEAEHAAIREWLHTLTKENLDDYFVINKESILTAYPDQNGWIDFGSYYDSYLECTVYGATGFLDYMIEEDENMRISGYGMSDDISDLRISVIFRNEDGSFTTAVYKAKDTIGEYIN